MKFTASIMFNFEADNYTDAQATALAALSGLSELDVKKIDLAAWATPTGDQARAVR